MNFTINELNIQSSVLNIFKVNPLIKSIIEDIHDSKNNNNVNLRPIVYLVGGTVRDILMGKSIKDIKDIDLEVHHLNEDQLRSILSKFGILRLAGRSFGVFKLDNLAVDWSLPRSDKEGRKPEVKIDPNMNIKQALLRRDLTINAMAVNLRNFNLVDPFNGFQDIKDKVLRSTDLSSFTEDPLRFFRVMQFISRFEFYPDDQLNQICKSMNISNISKERIEEEFNKLMLKGEKPSLGIRWLKFIARLKEVLPELANTIGVEQEYQWHPEGDVFEHSMQALDAASRLNYNNKEQKLIVLYAALCHDLGKATTTKYIKGRIRSWGHDVAGYKLTKDLLNRITNNKKLIEKVAILVRWHMQPLIFYKSGAKDAAYKRLAIKLNKSGVNLYMLALLAKSDRLGRNEKKMEPLDIEIKEVSDFMNIANKLKILTEPEKPILLGRDLIEFIPAGPLIGQILSYVYDKQIEGDILDKNVLKRLALDKINKMKKT